MNVLLKFCSSIVQAKVIFVSLISWTQSSLCSFMLTKIDRMPLALILQFTYWYLELLALNSVLHHDYTPYYISLCWVGFVRLSEWHWKWNSKSPHLKDLVLPAPVTQLADILLHKHGRVYPGVKTCLLMLNHKCPLTCYKLGSYAG